MKNDEKKFNKIITQRGILISPQGDRFSSACSVGMPLCVVKTRPQL